MEAAERNKQEFDGELGTTFTTDWIDSGITHSDSGPALQPFAEAAYRDLDADIWASNIDADDPADKDDEIELSAGVSPTIGDMSLDLGFVCKAYEREQTDIDYLEITASGDYQVNRIRAFWQPHTVTSSDPESLKYVY